MILHEGGGNSDFKCRRVFIPQVKLGKNVRAIPTLCRKLGVYIPTDCNQL